LNIYDEPGTVLTTENAVLKKTYSLLLETESFRDTGIQISQANSELEVDMRVNNLRVLCEHRKMPGAVSNGQERRAIQTKI
jgi:hypothetical protein